MANQQPLPTEVIKRGQHLQRPAMRIHTHGMRADGSVYPDIADSGV